MASSPSCESRRELFEGSISGAQDRPWIPRLRSDPRLHTAPSRSLVEFRAQEGAKTRERHFRELWERLPDAGTHLLDHEPHAPDDTRSGTSMPSKEAHKMVQQYDDELMGRCHGSMGPLRRKIRWKEFCSYVEAKETELWTIFHDELDLDGNGHLDVQELNVALERAGIKMPPGSMSDFMTYLTASPHSHSISFTEFRDFLLLLPRRASTAEIYRYYEVRRTLDPDSRGASRVNMEGDVSLSAEDHYLRALPTQAGPSSAADATAQASVDHEAHLDDEHDLIHEQEEEEHHHHWLGGATALKFLLAGGAAGAVSRTCTAPFDRLKIFLITRPPDLGGTPLTSLKPQAGLNGARAIGNAVHRIYLEGGIRGFWTGNALSVAKIFPESAIKFLSYESSKRMFAEYYDGVSDTRDISGLSRFLSGGIAGITSQLSIYPIETLKTRMMTSTGESKRSLSEAITHLYRMGGMRAYYRGLTIGLIGVFPYAAIDMSTFEALKLAYLKSTGKTDPGVLAMLAFGSVSGSVGASMVYPLNLVRTRLQAAGSSGHPQQYTGFRDVASQTYARDGWRGFYRGLIPTLTKVVPAVSISYVVYESSKRQLGV